MRKMNNKGISTILAVIALIVLIVVGCIVGIWFYLDLTKEEVVGDPYYGTMTLTIAELSTFDRSVVTTTTPKYEVFSPSARILALANRKALASQESTLNKPAKFGNPQFCLVMC